MSDSSASNDPTKTMPNTAGAVRQMNPSDPGYPLARVLDLSLLISRAMRELGQPEMLIAVKIRLAETIIAWIDDTPAKPSQD